MRQSDHLEVIHGAEPRLASESLHWWWLCWTLPFLPHCPQGMNILPPWEANIVMKCQHPGKGPKWQDSKCGKRAPRTENQFPPTHDLELKKRKRRSLQSGKIRSFQTINGSKGETVNSPWRQNLNTQALKVTESRNSEQV